MGRYVIKVPDIGEGMTEAEIVAWHVAPGQVIREEDPLVDVMTDKATVELPAPVAGTVVAIHGQPGERRPVGSELVELDVLGEGNAAEAVAAKPASIRGGIGPAQPLTPTLSPQEGRGYEPERWQTAPLPADGEREGPAAQAREGEEQLSSVPAAPIPTTRRLGTKPLASPAVRRRAWDLGSRCNSCRARVRAAGSLATSTPISPPLPRRHPAAAGAPLPAATVWKKCRLSGCAG